MRDVSADLEAALEAALAGTSAAQLQQVAGRMTAAYRSGELPGDQLGTPLAARAYAAYRMPATAAAVRAALRAAGPLPVRTLVDAGGGTGAALWAAAATCPELTAATVLDRSADALALGRELAGAAPAPVGTATWTRTTLSALPPADLVTIAYVLAELPAAARAALVAEAAGAGAVAVVEPGTPAGHRRVLDARDVLVSRGLRVVAPCPHDATCPLAAGDDWCHFSVRVPRSALHRRIKGGTVGWEDEKFSYVVAVRDGPSPVDGRIVRHPRTRKGLVEFPVCAVPPRIVPTKVTRSSPLWRDARDAAWGDPWPPHAAG